MKKSIFCVVLCVLLVFLASCTNDPEPVESIVPEESDVEISGNDSMSYKGATFVIGLEEATIVYWKPSEMSDELDYSAQICGDSEEIKAHFENYLLSSGIEGFNVSPEAPAFMDYRKIPAGKCISDFSITYDSQENPYFLNIEYTLGDSDTNTEDGMICFIFATLPAKLLMNGETPLGYMLNPAGLEELM